MLKLPTSLGCLLGTQPAVAGAGNLVELEIRIYWVEEGQKMQNKAWLSHLGASYPLDGAAFIASTVCNIPDVLALQAMSKCPWNF